MRFKLTKKQHNEIFKNSPIKFGDKYFYYYREEDNSILYEKYLNWMAVTIVTFFLPMTLIVTGLENYKEIISDTVDLYRQKKSGSFSVEYVFDKEKERVLKIINNKRK